MSENENLENRVEDTQNNHESTLEESQDFHLVDSGEEDEEFLNKSQDNNEKSDKSEEDHPSVINDNPRIEKNLNSQQTQNLEKLINKYSEASDILVNETPEIVDKENLSNEGCISINIKETLDDEDDDIVHGTPPAEYSSPKTNILKRKAMSFDEPCSKFLKTSSENTLSNVKKFVEPVIVNNSDKSNEQDIDKDIASTNFTNLSELTAKENISLTTSLDFNESNTKNDTDMASSVNVTESTDKEDTDTIDKSTVMKDNGVNNPTEVTPQSVVSDDNVTNSVKFDELTADKNSAKENSIDDNVTTKSEDNSVTQNDSDQIKDNVDKDATTECSNHTENSTESSNNHNSSTVTIVNTEPTESRDKVQEAIMREEKANYHKSRMSIEILFDKTAASQMCKSKATELVEIDEDGEKIVLDSSEEVSEIKPVGISNLNNSTNAEFIYKSCRESKNSSDFSYKSAESTKELLIDSKSNNHHINGSDKFKKCDTGSTASVESDIFIDDAHAILARDINMPQSGNNLNKSPMIFTSISKDSDNVELLSISDNDPEVSFIDDNIKNKSIAKALHVEKEIGIYVKLKCLLQIDESTKEFLSKELISVNCEPTIEPSSARHKNVDTSASLADISGNDNKDTSPGSVNSNPQLFHLNPSRFSYLSTVSSTSSASSAASLVTKLAAKDNTYFSLPRGPVKHMKKLSHELLITTDKQVVNESSEKLIKEWKNNHLLVTTILNYTNAELNSLDVYNISNDKLDDALRKIRCSTPEENERTKQQFVTPKSTKRGRAVKRPRSKNIKTGLQSNGLCKTSTSMLISARDDTDTPNTKKKRKIENTSTTALTSNISASDDLSSNMVHDVLLGNKVFAKWSDNKYYPGTVTDKVKTKYKVNFYDGKSKILIEDFIIPIPTTLNEGLSVYAITAKDDYGSSGIIINVQNSNDDVYYVVETDEGERSRIQLKDIFLTSDQARVLKEETNLEINSPSTPKHLGQISLDNVVDGKRRSKRIATPIFSAAKSNRRPTNSPLSKATDPTEPSVSGIASKFRKENIVSENENKSTDSNMSLKDDAILSGIQPEIIGTPNEQIVKGPQNKIKGKSRGKKKSESEEVIASLGPIPEENSSIFEGLSFILTCASLEALEKYKVDCLDSGSGTGTENEEEWVRKPFVRERLKSQILAGKGKVYDKFESIPQEEYKSTKLITNVPNTTAKNLLCLSVGIPAYNHSWIIQCCQEGKLVNSAGWSLPSGWSLEKQSYIEVFQRPNSKPLAQVMVIIPLIISDKEFSSFWRQICENVGAIVLIVDNPESMERYEEGTDTVIITNRKCPSWALVKANKLQIPLLSTVWIIQCLIEGKMCLYEQPRYKYNYIQK